MRQHSRALVCAAVVHRRARQAVAHRFAVCAGHEWGAEHAAPRLVSRALARRTLAAAHTLAVAKRRGLLAP